MNSKLTTTIFNSTKKGSKTNKCLSILLWNELLPRLGYESFHLPSFFGFSLQWLFPVPNLTKWLGVKRWNHLLNERLFCKLESHIILKKSKNWRNVERRRPRWEINRFLSIYPYSTDLLTLVIPSLVYYCYQTTSSSPYN